MKTLPTTVMTAVLVLTAATFAGNLNPPVGPVNPTLKDLVQVEPRTAINATNTPGNASNTYVISQPGSYYLTGNVQGEAGKSGIQIGASNVTIDLCGFAMLSTGVLSGTAVTTLGARTDITVRNGSAIGWNGHGFLLSNTSGSILSNLQARDCNNGSGMIGGTGGRIIDCVASNNSAVGISVGVGGAISGCTARENTNGGIHTSSAGVTIVDCAAGQNDGPGFIVEGSGCGISRCTASFNGSDGFDLSAHCRITGCTAYNNGQTIAGAGIHARGADNTIEGNTVTNNDIGIDVDAAGNLITRNTASGNTINFVIVAGNITGTIVTTEAALNAATNSNVNIGF